MMRFENIYQGILILLGLVATLLFGIFFYREMFPEYLIYQDAYVALEEFRSTYTGQPPPEFKKGIKQIVLLRDDKGPETIDRCISCHVALQFEHFSPTKVARDVNGNVLYQGNGAPLLEKNEEYVWLKLDEKITSLEKSGKRAEAEKLKALKTAHVGDHDYDITVVLKMHPLIGKETRPFEFHPMDAYGCISCHSGNGRGLVTDRAHGPIFDEEYEEEYEGPVPQFLEKDEKNDPRFARVFNHKPGGRLLFQTTPLLVGDLIQAKCVQCHQPTLSEWQTKMQNAEILLSRREKELENLQKGLYQDTAALMTLLKWRKEIQEQGADFVLKELEKRAHQTPLTTEEFDQRQNELDLFKKWTDGEQKIASELILQNIDKRIRQFVGSVETAEQLQTELTKATSPQEGIETFLKNAQGSTQLSGILFAKAAAHNLAREAIRHLQDTQTPLSEMVEDPAAVAAMKTDVDILTNTYQRGQELYLSQACYACHRIAGLARGGVGPELSREGMSYPWFVKQSIVWPQADLKTSTMPNMRLDHEEVEALLTFLLAQRNDNKTSGKIQAQNSLKAWEEGQKLSWEKPLPPTEIRNVRNSMILFATEGCASCHRLKSFDSNVGYAVEKEKPSQALLFKESEWFQSLFPEEILGSKIVEVIDKNSAEIDRRIVDNVRKEGILEEIEQRFPGSIEALYSNFKFANRAKNHTSDPAAWKQRVHRVLMMYIQEYGLGRLIGPLLNWSGVYRSDQWLMEHFWNPQSHSPRSLMPVFPFDDSKFQALVYMLDVLGQKNRKAVKAIWEMKGFNPEQAVEIFCAHCHGSHLQGNGPLAEWLYPIPKNLQNGVFLRNLTKAHAKQSILHGVPGTPMPPWGEAADDKPIENKDPVLSEEEADQLVNWLYRNLPKDGSMLPTQEGIKWNYQPEDVLKELKREKDFKRLGENSK